MVATQFLDAMARMPDCDGEDSDAVGAYTQVKLDELDHLIGKDVSVDTSVSLPKNRWPKNWEGMDHPVCLLRRNL